MARCGLGVPYRKRLAHRDDAVGGGDRISREPHSSGRKIDSEGPDRVQWTK